MLPGSRCEVKILNKLSAFSVLSMAGRYVNEANDNAIWVDWLTCLHLSSCSRTGQCRIWTSSQSLRRGVGISIRNAKLDSWICRQAGRKCVRNIHQYPVLSAELRAQFADNANFSNFGPSTLYQNTDLIRSWSTLNFPGHSGCQYHNRSKRMRLFLILECVIVYAGIFWQYFDNII